MKKLWGFIVATIAIIATYIGFNQLTNRQGDSQTPSNQQNNYDLGLPKSAGTGGGTRNTEKDVQ